MRNPALILTVAVLSACTSTARPVPDGGDPGPALTVSQARGLAFAKRRCSGCHTVGPDDGGAQEGPAFRSLSLRYNALSLERRFAEVSAHGYDHMPPVTFTRSEAEDLVAYVETLERR